MSEGKIAKTIWYPNYGGGITNVLCGKRKEKTARWKRGRKAGIQVFVGCAKREHAKDSKTKGFLFL